MPPAGVGNVRNCQKIDFSGRGIEALAGAIRPGSPFLAILADFKGFSAFWPNSGQNSGCFCQYFLKNGQNTSAFWRVFDPFLTDQMCTISRSIFSSSRIAIYTGGEESRKYHWYLFPSHMGRCSKLVAWSMFLTRKCQILWKSVTPGGRKVRFF